MACKANIHPSIKKKKKYRVTVLIPISTKYVLAKWKKSFKNKLANVTVIAEISFQNCVQKNITSLFTMNVSHNYLAHMKNNLLILKLVLILDYLPLLLPHKILMICAKKVSLMYFYHHPRFVPNFYFVHKSKWLHRIY